MSTTLTPSLTASAAVAPNTFIKITGDFQGGPCGAGDMAFGIASSGTREAPIDNASTNNAEIGDPIEFNGMHETTLLRVAATVTFGQLLKPDAAAKGVVAATGNQFSAQVLRGAANGGLAEVFICRGVAP